MSRIWLSAGDWFKSGEEIGQVWRAVGNKNAGGAGVVILAEQRGDGVSGPPRVRGFEFPVPGGVDAYNQPLLMILSTL